MTVPAPSPAVQSLLRNIAATAQSFLDKTTQPVTHVNPPAPPTPVSPPITSETFPDPPDLVPLLLSFGARADIASQINTTFRSRIHDFKRHCQTSVTEACLRIAQLPSPNDQNILQEKILKAFSGLYNQAVQSWIEKALSMVKTRVDEVTSQRPSNKLTQHFNHEYIPLLEHFFSENPFPSHADKVFLAKKSGMTYRQIHVWFQNHRSRAKKDNKPLRKKPMSEGATLPFDGMLRRMGKYVKDPQQSYQEPRSANESFVHSTPKVAKLTASTCHAFDKPAPAHAFPTPYPPTCPYDPFSQDYHHLRPQKGHWPRQLHPALPRPPDLEANSIVDMIEKFAEMNVRDESGTRSRKNLNSSRAAICAITVRPCVAPHPALVRSTVLPKPHVPLLPVISARSAQTHVFKEPSLRSPLTSLVPIDQPNRSARLDPTKRKFAPLPKRFPNAERNAPRSASPTVSEASILSPSVSRLSSFNSDDFFVFPGSDSSSGSSSSVDTPEPSPTVRPTGRTSCSPVIPALLIDPGREYLAPRNARDLDNFPCSLIGFTMDAAALRTQAIV